MTNYYLLENGIVTQSADFKFSEDCLETQEEIVRDELSGQLYLQNDYNILTETEDYKAEVSAKENVANKTQLQSQIEELDKKRIRAIAEPSVKDESTGQTWLEFYNSQIADLRAQIAQLG